MTTPARGQSAGVGIGPLALLAGCLLPVAGAFAVTTPGIGWELLAGEIVAFGWLVRDPRSTAARLVVGAVAALTIALSTWLYAGHDASRTLAAALRILCIVVPAALLSPMIRPDQLGDHLAQRLHLPARPVAASVAALQRVELLGDQWRQVLAARRTRGYGVDGGPVRRVRALAGAAFALLVSAMRHTGLLALAMDARGFATAQRRTWAGPAPWGRLDSLVLIAAVALAVLPHLVA
jgi:energy-coupling factor transporter transmembrane protein EcfT